MAGTLPIARAFRHLFTTTSAGRRAFPQATLTAIQSAIAAGELAHRAEVRFIVEPALSFGDAWEGLSSRDRARELFAQYGVWDTEENVGVLVYVNLADHKVEIVTDRGIGKVIAAGEWQSVCRTMTEGFKQGRFHDSTLAALERLNGLLVERLPARTGDGQADSDELPNQPIIL